MLWQQAERGVSFKQKPVPPPWGCSGPQGPCRAGEGQASCKGAQKRHVPFFLEAQMGLAHP